MTCPRATFIGNKMAGDVAGPTTNGIKLNTSNGVVFSGNDFDFLANAVNCSTAVTGLTITGNKFGGSSGGTVTTPLANFANCSNYIFEANSPATGWISYTPTITCLTGGPPTLASNTAAFKKLGKTMFIRMQVIFSANNGCLGNIIATYPASTTSAGGSVIAGQEFNSVGWAVQGVTASAGGSTFAIFKYDGTNPGDANTRGFALSGAVEIQ